MKTLVVRIEVPLTDDATDDDAETLAKQVEHLALTQRASLADPVTRNSRVYGRVVGWELLS